MEGVMHGKEEEGEEEEIMLFANQLEYFQLINVDVCNTISCDSHVCCLSHLCVFNSMVCLD